MTTDEKRQRLIDWVADASEAEVLELCQIVSDRKADVATFQLPDAEWSRMEREMKAYRNGEIQGESWQDVRDRMLSKIRKRA